MTGLEFLDKAIGDGLKLALDELMGDPVASCDVCGNAITRAEELVLQAYDITFGCIRCALQRKKDVPREAIEPEAPAPEPTRAPTAQNAVKEPVSLSRGILARPTAETQRPVVNARAQGQAVRQKPGRPRKEVKPEAVEPEATIEVEPPSVATPEPEAPTTVVCTTCQRTLPERLLAMHRANCERANAGIS